MQEYQLQHADQGVFQADQLDWSLIEVKDGKVYGRGLWKFLEISQEFTNWIKYQIESLGLVEGFDFDIFVKPHENNKKEFLLTVDTAKHIALASRTERGKEARKYFIEMEKKAKEQPKQLSTLDLLKQAVVELEKKETEINKLTTETTNLATRDLEVKTQKDYKWKSQVLQNDRGRTINYYVNKHFFEGDYREAHNKAKEAYREATGVILPNNAKLMSQEQKKDYLLWLSKIT